MLVLIRGAGDLATGIAVRLRKSGCKVIMLELCRPTSIRRTVCFSQAVLYGSWTVEGVEARLAVSPEEAIAFVDTGIIAVLTDPKGYSINSIHPDAVVDAILAKKNLGTRIIDAPVVIGVGPGFTAGKDCHAVVETMRGHDLGRVLYKGSAAPDTGIPGNINGHSADRLLRAPADGIFHPLLDIGATVIAGDAVGEVSGHLMYCQIGGTLRGILSDGVQVHKGMKSGDVDPRGNADYCTRVSDKALAIGGGVLEAILCLSGILNRPTKI